MGISLQSVSCMELGKKAIRPDNLVNLCVALDTTADYILTDTKSDKELSELCKVLIKLSPEDYKLTIGCPSERTPFCNRGRERTGTVLSSGHDSTEA